MTYEKRLHLGDPDMIQSCSLSLHPHTPKLQLITFCYHKISMNAEIPDCLLVQVHVVWMCPGR